MPFGFVSAPISYTFKGIKVCHLGLFLLQYILVLPFGLVSSPITLIFIVTEKIK